MSSALAGIDVSAVGQGPHFDWEAWRGKIAFAGIKVSEGTGFADPDAKHNIAGARSIGARPMGYHFLHNGTGSQGGAPQARWFLQCAKKAGLRPGDLIAVDVEDLGLGDVDRGNPAAVEQALIHFDLVAAGFSNELRKHFPSFWPELYTEISIAPYLKHNGNCPLWLANPSRVHTGAIGPWKQVSFEQTGQRGVDSDLFYGSSAQLAGLGFRK